MKGHSAIPQPQDPDRIGEQVGRVEQDIAKPPAQDDAERRVEDEVVGMTPRHRRARLVEQLEQIPPADQDAGDIGQRIPFELEEAEVERHRIQPEIGELEMAGAGGEQGQDQDMGSGKGRCRRFTGLSGQTQALIRMPVPAKAGQAVT